MIDDGVCISLMQRLFTNVYIYDRERIKLLGALSMPYEISYCRLQDVVSAFAVVFGNPHCVTMNINLLRPIGNFRSNFPHWSTACRTFKYTG